jgi:hypothetical protein
MSTFQEFITTQLVNCGFTNEEANKLFTENDEMFVCAFAPLNTLKLLGSSLISSSFFLQNVSNKDINVGKMTFGLQNFEKDLCKKAISLGFHNYCDCGDEENCAKNNLKSFCGVLGVILKNNVNEIISKYLLTPQNFNSEKNSLVQLIELWMVVYGKLKPKFRVRKSAMFKISKQRGVYQINVRDPYTKKVILTVRHSSENAGLQQASDKAIKYIKNNY